jgi:hypothetical protein
MMVQGIRARNENHLPAAHHVSSRLLQVSITVIKARQLSMSCLPAVPFVVTDENITAAMLEYIQKNPVSTRELYNWRSEVVHIHRFVKVNTGDKHTTFRASSFRAKMRFDCVKLNREESYQNQHFRYARLLWIISMCSRILCIVAPLFPLPEVAIHSPGFQATKEIFPILQRRACVCIIDPSILEQIEFALFTNVRGMELAIIDPFYHSTIMCSDTGDSDPLNISDDE